jgi:hypothetical protein
MALALDLLRELLTKLFFLRLLPALFAYSCAALSVSCSGFAWRDSLVGFRLADAFQVQVQVQELQ